MAKFETLTGAQAKRIEEEALKPFFSEIKKSEKKEGELLFKAKSIFPFQLFPDELFVYPDRITLITRVGPRMSQMRDMHLHDIAQVEADTGPVFGHLHIYPKLRTEEPFLIDRLSRSEALKAREVIESMLTQELPAKESTY